MIKVTICIPTYNRAEFLKKNVEQVISQNTNDFYEIIVSDNASTDDTQRIIEELSKKNPQIKYFRNEQNIGLDQNTKKVLGYCEKEYIWLLSDDDLILKGTLAKIEDIIYINSPDLIYLNHAGYLESENYDIVCERNSNLPDVIYDNGEDMVRDRPLNHFSCSVFRRELANKFSNLTYKYQAEGYGRGFAFAVIVYHIVLNSKGPCIFIGQICLAVRNPIEVDFNPILVIIIDNARFYQSLQKSGLICKSTERKRLHWLIKGLYRFIIPMKCNKDPHYTADYGKWIISLYKKYPLFYVYMFPFIILPRWCLLPPYLLYKRFKKNSKYLK